MPFFFFFGLKLGKRLVVLLCRLAVDEAGYVEFDVVCIGFAIVGPGVVLAGWCANNNPGLGGPPAALDPGLLPDREKLQG